MLEVFSLTVCNILGDGKAFEDFSHSPLSLVTTRAAFLTPVPATVEQAGEVTELGFIHYSDVIMGAMASQITSLTIVEGIDTEFEVMAVTPQTPKCHHNRGVAEVVVTFGSLWCHSHDRKRGINFYFIMVPQN